MVLQQGSECKEKKCSCFSGNTSNAVYTRYGKIDWYLLDITIISWNNLLHTSKYKII